MKMAMHARRSLNAAASANAAAAAASSLLLLPVIFISNATSSTAGNFFKVLKLPTPMLQVFSIMLHFHPQLFDGFLKHWTQILTEKMCSFLLINAFFFFLQDR